MAANLDYLANHRQPAKIIPTVKLLINGEFVESHSTEWRDIVNPATQEVLARVPFATTDEVNAAIEAGRVAFKTWKDTPISTRARVFLKLQQLIRENMVRLAEGLTAEQGKTLVDAEGDIFRGLEVVEHACSIGNLQLGEFAENVASGVDTYSIRQPLGVCAGITPFNFPAMIPLWMFPMAIVCGNTFVLKPSEQVPMTSMLLADLAIQAGVPAGVLNVVHGGKDVVDLLCTHKDIKAVSFVGSCHVGEHVYHLGSKHGKRVQSMMGAKNHCVIMPDANKEQALNALAGAAFGAAGQRCMAISVSVLVGEANQWIPDLVAKAKSLKVAPGTEKGADVGPLVSKAAKQRVTGLIEKGIAEGAKLELDGSKVNVSGHERGNFVGPTIFSGVKPSMSIYDTEIFGPVLSVVSVDTLDEAIDHINEHNQGHSDSILTADPDHAQRFVAEVDAAAVYVNSTTRFTDGGEFGLGAEVAVSTQRLHARGPMGLRELTTYKWVGSGDYLVRGPR